MRRVVVLALLALVLPIAAWADGITLTNEFGTASVTTAGIVVDATHSSQLISWTGIPAGVQGNVTFSTGALLTGTIAAGGTFAGGGTFDIVGVGSWAAKITGAVGCGAGCPLFTGSFVGPVAWTLTSGSSTSPLTYTLTGTVTGMLWNGHTVTGTTTQNFVVFPNVQPGIAHLSGGTTFLPVPEPGTLGLLGSGLAGIAGMFRRKLRGA